MKTLGSILKFKIIGRNIMAEEAKTTGKKETKAKVETAQKKALTKRKINKGQTLACQVCGLSVVVEEIGGVAVEEDSVLLCCGKAMKEKATAKKVAKK
jgi:hypothetical protein